MQTFPPSDTGDSPVREFSDSGEQDNQATFMNRLEGVGSTTSARVETGPIENDASGISVFSPGLSSVDTIGAALPLAAKVTAGIGLEIEVADVRVVPYHPRGTVLFEGTGWQLETDNAGNDFLESDIEFVTKPMFHIDDLNKAMNEILHFVILLRQKALAAENRSVRLLDIVPHARIDCALSVEDLNLLARLQVTYGIGLEQIAESQKKILGDHVADKVQGDTIKVAQFYHDRFGEHLSEKAKGFIHIINYYILRATGGLPALMGTAHIYFMMMARSDFCSIFDKLLDQKDQEQIKHLFFPVSNEALPAFLAALGRSETDFVFDKPYWDRWRKQKVDGPRIKDWLASIIRGRHDGGAFKKDLMSPPAGYPLHTGSENDYGMGAMGVDQVNGLVLFEVRGSQMRPEEITMNQHLKMVVQKEFLEAQTYNSVLTCNEHPVRPDDRKDAYWKCLASFRKKIDDVLFQLDLVHSDFFKYDDTQKRDVTNVLNRAIEAIEVLQNLLPQATSDQSKTTIEKLEPDFQNFRHMVNQLAVYDDLDDHKTFFLHRFRDPVLMLEKNFWDLEAIPFPS